MLNVLCVCGNGMGTSTILKISVKKICDENNIDAIVESCSFGEAMSYVNTTDVILTSPEWADMLPPHNAALAVTKNLIDAKGVAETLLAAIKEKFPNEIK